jgi:hypothetical protein
VYAADEGPLTQHGMVIGTYIDIEKVKGEIRDAGNRLFDQAVAKATSAGCHCFNEWLLGRISPYS